MKRIILLLFFVLFISLNACEDRTVNDRRVTVVKSLPAGFIKLKEALDELDNGMHFVFWETQVSVADSDEVCIYQTDINDGSFLVEYKKEPYVNEKKFFELVDIADVSPVQRRKVYSMGDEVEIHGAGENLYTVKIISVEAGKTEPYYQDTLTTYIIKFIATSSVSVDLSKLISKVETENGVSYSPLEFINSESVRVKIRGDDKIKSIILKNPEYMGLAYKIVVDE